MSYTLSVKFKSENQKDRMEQFLLAQSDILDKMDIVEHHYLTKSHALGDMSSGYAPKQKNLLGFHVSISPRYIWDLCAWMAVKADYKDKKDNLFFYYDNEKMLVTFDINNNKNTLVDHNGIGIDNPDKFKKDGVVMTMIHYIRGEKEKRQTIKKLFIQLNNNWNNFNLNNENLTLKKNKI